MQIIEAQPIKETVSLAIVVSRFNREITQGLYQGALARLKELDFPEEKITVVWVPGAVEIPITAQQLARTGRYAAIICLGAVIRGDTDHYDYVCRQVSDGCQQVALTHNLPIIFGVLTTATEELALARASHDQHNKGRDCAEAALEMVAVLKRISSSWG